MRFAAYIGRALRAAADLLERRSGDTALGAAPDADENSLAALRERYPGAPDHWLRLVARQLSEGGLQPRDATTGEENRSATAPRSRAPSSPGVKKPRGRSIGTAPPDKDFAAIDRGSLAPDAQPLRGSSERSTGSAPPSPAASAARAGRDGSTVRSTVRKSRRKPVAFRRPAGTADPPATRVKPRFHAVPATSGSKLRAPAALPPRVVRSIREITARFSAAGGGPCQASSAPEFSPPPAAPAPDLPSRLSLATPAPSRARRTEQVFVPAGEPAVPPRAPFALPRGPAAASRPGPAFPRRSGHRTDLPDSEWLTPAVPRPTPDRGLAAAVSDPQWPELPEVIPAHAQWPGQASTRAATEQALEQVRDRWNALPF